MYIHVCLYFVCRHSGREGSSVMEGVLGMGGKGALLSVKRKVFFLQLFKMDMFTQSIYLKKTEFVFSVYITRYFKAIKIFKIVCLVIW